MYRGLVETQLLRTVLLRDREKGKFEMFSSAQIRNLNFPAAAAETSKAVTREKWNLLCTAAETIKGGHPR